MVLVKEKGDDKAMDAVSRQYPVRFWKLQSRAPLMLSSTCHKDISLMDAENDAATYVQDLTGEDTNIIFGALYDDKEADYVRITVIATSLDNETTRKASVERNKKDWESSSRRPSEARQLLQEQPQQQAPSYQMPTFQQPTFQQTPPTFQADVPKKDIQIPDFLKNRR